MKTMMAVVTYAPYDYRFEEVPIPQIGPGEILLKVTGCGICASDIKTYHGSPRLWGTSSKDRYITPPVIGGHELCGDIVDIADDVKGFDIGDFVVPEQVVPCNECSFCRQGTYWNCAISAVIGFKDYCNGGFAEYVKLHKNSLVHKVPDGFTTEQAVLVEPLACGMHAIEQADIQYKDVVVIAGLGAIGLGMMDMAKLCLPRKVIGIDVKEKRLDMGRAFGADAIIDASSEDSVSLVKDLTDGMGCDVYFEVSGNGASVMQGMDMLKNMGRYVQIGVFASEVTANWNLIGDGKELTIKGSHLSALTYPSVLKGIGSGQIKTQGLISHTFHLKDWKEAFETAEKDPDAMKVMLIP